MSGKNFNKIEWIVKAEARFFKKKDRPNAASTYAEELRAINGLERAVKWAQRRGLTVSFVPKGGVFFSKEKLITVSSRMSPREQLFTLLHECGHFLIGPRRPGDRFGMGYAAPALPRHKGSALHRIDILDEEFEAWARGWKLGRKLGALLDADRKAFDERRVQCLMTYAKWASRGPGFEGYSSSDPSGGASAS